MDSYISVAKAAQGAITEKKSVFTAYVSPAEDEAAAIFFIGEVSGNNAKASHNVYAYRVGVGRTDEKYSDAGEPPGTAGLPVLSVLRKEGLTNVAVVITRFFGGVLLGAGGLSRAYQAACRAGLMNAGLAEMRPYQILTATVPYAYAGKIIYDAPRCGYIVKDAAYLEDAAFTVHLPVQDAGAFEERVRDMTNGAAVITRGECIYHAEHI